MPLQITDEPLGSRLRLEPDVLPIIAIAGTRGKSTVAWMLSAMIEASGQPYASWLSSGVYVDGELQQGELRPWSRVVLAARHGEIDVALQEMVAAAVIGAGLPEHAYPLAILTVLCGNNEACLLNPETELERRALSIVVRAARADGVIVANADDYDIVALLEQTQAKPLLYALHRENPALQRHLAEGGRGLWIENGWMFAGDSGQADPILPVGEIPATLDGTILFQIQNALAATAAALAIGVPHQAIVSALRVFEPDPDVQPAACNILRYNDATILVDAPRHVHSLRMLARGIRHKPHRRTLVISGCFPGLDDQEAKEAGRILGDLAGIVLLHGENASEERMDAIKSGIAAAAVPPIVLSIPNELRAIDHLLNIVGPDDVALVIADDREVVLEHVWPAPAISVESHLRTGSVSPS